jgi:hypothetical protein
MNSGRQAQLGRESVMSWTDVLSKCDLLMARQEMIEFHQTIEREAEQKGA